MAQYEDGQTEFSLEGNRENSKPTTILSRNTSDPREAKAMTTPSVTDFGECPRGARRSSPILFTIAPMLAVVLIACGRCGELTIVFGSQMSIMPSLAKGQGTSLYGLLDTILFTIAPMLIE